jgi:hypothetical protein
MNLGRLFKSKPTPRIAESPPVNFMASGELGNTTIKCTLTATDLITGKTYIVDKTVKMTRDVRIPWPMEEVFSLLSTARS